MANRGSNFDAAILLISRDASPRISLLSHGGKRDSSRASDRDRSDLPGPILAQVSQNVFDSATGKYLLVPQGSRLIGVCQNASLWSATRRDCVAAANLPDHSSMISQMPEPIRAATRVSPSEQPLPEDLRNRSAHESHQRRPGGGTDGAFGGCGAYGPYGYSSRINGRWRAEAGSAASGQFGAVGGATIGRNELTPTIEIRPGYQFNVMVTKVPRFPRLQRGERTQIVHGTIGMCSNAQNRFKENDDKVLKRRKNQRDHPCASRLQ